MIKHQSKKNAKKQAEKNNLRLQVEKKIDFIVASYLKEEKEKFNSILNDDAVVKINEEIKQFLNFFQNHSEKIKTFKELFDFKNINNDLIEGIKNEFFKIINPNLYLFLTQILNNCGKTPSALVIFYATTLRITAELEIKVEFELNKSALGKTFNDNIQSKTRQNAISAVNDFMNKICKELSAEPVRECKSKDNPITEEKEESQKPKEVSEIEEEENKKSEQLNNNTAEEINVNEPQVIENKNSESEKTEQFVTENSQADSERLASKINSFFIENMEMTSLKSLIFEIQDEFKKSNFNLQTQINQLNLTVKDHKKIIESQNLIIDEQIKQILDLKLINETQSKEIIGLKGNYEFLLKDHSELKSRFEDLTTLYSMSEEDLDFHRKKTNIIIIREIISKFMSIFRKKYSVGSKLDNAEALDFMRNQALMKKIIGGLTVYQFIKNLLKIKRNYNRQIHTVKNFNLNFFFEIVQGDDLFMSLTEGEKKELICFLIFFNDDSPKFFLSKDINNHNIMKYNDEECIEKLNERLSQLKI